MCSFSGCSLFYSVYCVISEASRFPFLSCFLANYNDRSRSVRFSLVLSISRVCYMTLQHAITESLTAQLACILLVLNSISALCYSAAVYSSGTFYRPNSVKPLLSPLAIDSKTASILVKSESPSLKEIDEIPTVSPRSKEMEELCLGFSCTGTMCC